MQLPPLLSSTVDISLCRLPPMVKNSFSKFGRQTYRWKTTEGDVDGGGRQRGEPHDSGTSPEEEDSRRMSEI
ncbi:hypothetical protein LXL04_012047 [Taraxacum kok-saghyz]